MRLHLTLDESKTVSRVLGQRINEIERALKEDQAAKEESIRGILEESADEYLKIKTFLDEKIRQEEK